MTAQKPSPTPSRDNPSPMGHNNPPLPAQIAEAGAQLLPSLVTDYLKGGYAKLEAEAQALLDEARTVPTKLEEEADVAKATSIVKRIREMVGAIESHHTKEKDPYFRSAQSVDQFFFGWWGKLRRRNPRDQAGAADILQARLDDYAQRKLAEENARRRRELGERERAEREARERAEREAAEAEAARLAAERARAPAQVEAKREVAAEAEKAADAAHVEVEVAAAKTEDAYIATLAKPADVVRERHDGGAMLTMGREPFAVVIDRTKLDYAKLAPYFKLDEIEKAYRAYAKANSYADTAKMDGADHGYRNRTKVL